MRGDGGCDYKLQEIGSQRVFESSEAFEWLHVVLIGLSGLGCVTEFVDANLLAQSHQLWLCIILQTT